MAFNDMERAPITVDEVVRVLDPSGMHKPLLWVGAGLSIAAGHPSTQRILETLQEDAGGKVETTGEFTEVVDRFVAREGRHAFETVLARLFATPRHPTQIHQAIARLARRGCFAAVVTTNYDRLVESAFETAGVQHISQVLDRNENLVLDGPIRLIKLHGSLDDWRTVVLSGASYADFNRRYERLFAQVDVLLRTRRLILAGCSLQDPRLVDWLATAGPDTPRWHPVVLKAEWERARSAFPALSRPTVQPWILPSHEEMPELWRKVAARLDHEESSRIGPLEASLEASTPAPVCEVDLNDPAGLQLQQLPTWKRDSLKRDRESLAFVQERLSKEIRVLHHAHANAKGSVKTDLSAELAQKEEERAKVEVRIEAIDVQIGPMAILRP